MVKPSTDCHSVWWRVSSTLKYSLVRCCRYVVNRSKASIMNLKDMRVQFTIVYLGYLSNMILTVALGLGLYTQYTYTGSTANNTTILAITFLGLIVFVVSCAMRYYFGFESVGKALLHIWLGCILGVLVFNYESDYQYVTTQEVMNILLLSSTCVGWFWNLCERFLHLKKPEPHIFSTTESLESLGFVISSLLTGNDAIAITFMVIAFIFNLTAIRFKSLLGVLTLIVFISVASFVFFPDLDLKVNVYGLVCFTGRLAFEPILDLYFSGLSTLERWQMFFNQSKFIRHTAIILLFILNLGSATLIGRLSANHKEWFVVVPLFSLFSVFWLCFHVIFFISCWKLMRKITECNLMLGSISDERMGMNRAMASKGIRHFSLISHRLMCLTLLTTVILMGVGWETKNCYSISIIMIILPIEAMTLSLFWEMGDFLGGTCVGYAIIAPQTGQKNNGSAKLLNNAVVQDMNSRATNTLNKMQKFFNFNMIENFGCDFSSSGLSCDYLESKVKQFFDKKTPDGPRFDTYILYYCGDVYDSGDWALSGNGNLNLSTLIEWWSQKNCDSGSRLILVLDTRHSWAWAKDVTQLCDDYIAIQTCKFARPSDPEFGENSNVGSFTEDWVQFNLEHEVEPSWSQKERIVRAVYKVSKSWTDFTFHLPTAEDIEGHWDSNFPKFTKPLIKAVNFFGTGSLFCCCDGFTKCLKRARMKWIPPKSTDTGHGFKLVRS